MTRRKFIAAAGAAGIASVYAGSLFGQADPPSPRKGRKPNVIVIFVDDLMYQALSFTNPDGPPTPRIDSLGKEGVFFQSGYCAQPWCGPSRAGILTGRHPRRFGFKRNYDLLPREGAKRELTIADLMSDAGYVTCMVGKYGNLGPAGLHPADHGFQDSFYFRSGGHPNIVPPEQTHKDLFRNGKPVEGETDFLPLIWGREAAGYVNKYKDKPFFLYVAPNQPHGPIEASAEYLQRFRHVPDEKKRTMMALMAGLDDGVGMILDAVKRNGLDEHTVIFFSNDNGGGRASYGFGNGPFTGGKHSLTEGGIRVPTFCRWTGHLKPGTVYPHPVTTLDFLPTAVALAGGTLPEKRVYDGVDLMPYLTGRTEGPPERVLFWFKCGYFRGDSHGVQALRYGDWKLRCTEGKAKGRKETVRSWHLIHLPTNPSEKLELQKNAEHPQLLAALVAAAAQAEKQVLADQPVKVDLPKMDLGGSGRPTQ